MFGCVSAGVGTPGAPSSTGDGRDETKGGESQGPLPCGWFPAEQVGVGTREINVRQMGLEILGDLVVEDETRHLPVAEVQAVVTGG